jgi:predicted nicotinamide N-methyase
VEVELIMLPQTEEMVILEDLVFQKEVLVDKLVNLHLDLMQQELVVVEQQRLELQVQHLQVVDQELEEQVLLTQLQDLM